MTTEVLILTETDTELVISEISDTLVVETSTSPELLEIVTQGPQGPPGTTTVIGADLNYVHSQMVPSSIWTITHNLNKYPSTTVIDSADSLVIGSIVYIDSNNIQLEFSAAFSGTAYLN